MKSHPISILLIGICPLMWAIAVILRCVGEFTQNPTALRLGMIALALAMKTMLPLGICCAVQSWRMSRSRSTPSDKHDLIEFLLGASGFVTIVLGAIFATY